MQFEHLPDEIVQACLLSLIPDGQELFDLAQYYNSPGKEELATLRALCLVNKQCLRLAQPLLYHALFLADFRKPTFKHISTKFVLHPHLPKFVRLLHFEGWEPGRVDEEPEDFVPLEPLVADQFRAALNAVSPRLKRVTNTIMTGLEQGWADAHLAFILALCQNLELLRIVLPFEFSEDSFVHTVLQQFAYEDIYRPSRGVRQLPSAAIRMPKLRVFEVRHHDTEGSSAIENIAGFMIKSTIEVLKGSMISITGDDDRFDVEPWALRRVELTESLMDSAGLEWLLKCCSRLEHLDINYGGATVSEEGCEIDFREFAKAFRNHGRGLQTISINTCNWFNPGDNYVTHSFGDLTALNRLRQLSVPRAALLGDGEADSDLEDEEDFEPQDLTATLPSSLESLTMQEYKYNFEDAQIEEMDGKVYDLVCSELFTQLRRIELTATELSSRREDLRSLGWILSGGVLRRVNKLANK